MLMLRLDWGVVYWLRYMDFKMTGIPYEREGDNEDATDFEGKSTWTPRSNHVGTT